MATVRKNQVKKIRFELTKSAIAGIAVIVFCLFLWMFLLGVWAGQSLLFPSYGQKPAVVEEKGKVVETPTLKAEKKTVKKGE
jgi:hypothetical protein